MSEQINRGGGRGLGRGLDALFMDDDDLTESSSKIDVSLIVPNSYQPRRLFREEELQALTDSIRRNGVLTPILVRPSANGYELIAGERRWRAAKLAGLEEIPALIREVDSEDALTFAIVENEQRDNLSAIESAHAYQRLIDEFGYGQQQVAEAVGVSRAQVSNLLRLQQLPISVQRLIERRELSMGQARPLVGLAADRAEQLADSCVQEGWSARRMEQEAKKAARAAEPKVHDNREVIADAETESLKQELAHHIGMGVEVVRNRKGGGKVMIAFEHVGEFESLLNRLRSGS
ncbi:MAG: ParB/RepB/Spo0J family partition protein [Mariprofundales bacterium]|nr:ParB/RepB/Spo0J family partition protein [Mariprofundales bacterium]